MIKRRIRRFYKGEIKDILAMYFSKENKEERHVKLFEKKFAQYVGVKFAVATCSGRNGFGLILDSLGLNSGDEIIMPAYTLKNLIYLIADKGLKAKLIDIDGDSFNINPDLIEGRITEKTKVIVATHIFGLPCNMGKISNIARKYNLKVIEDCAHACGAEYGGKKVGSLGEAGFFSFESTKLINTFDGGMVTTDNEELACKIRQKLNKYRTDKNKVMVKALFTYLEHLFTKSPAYPILLFFLRFKPVEWVAKKIYFSLRLKSKIGYLRFTELQALLGLRQLEYLEQRNTKRQHIADEITRRLKADVYPQRDRSIGKRVYYYYILRLPVKYADKARIKMLRYGIDIGIEDEITNNCSGTLIDDYPCPVTEQVFKCALQIPMYDDLSSKEITIIAHAVNSLT
ncbi:MAG: DegT/DnrJ/EryC1/StrS family aminotransferase [Candidatus Omnitrophota bacterium]